MFYITTGSSGSTKTACLLYLKERLGTHELVDFDNIGVSENAYKIWLKDLTEKCLRRYRGQDKLMVTCSQMVTCEFIAYPSFSKIEELKVCLFDCSDIEHIKRLKARGTYGAEYAELVSMAKSKRS